MKKFLLYVVALSFLASCGPSTKIEKSWRDPSSTVSSASVDKILFAALVKDESTRRVTEDKLCALSNGKGIASYSYFAADEQTKSDDAAVAKRLKGDGIDLVVIMRLQNVEKETSYVPGSGMSGYGGYWGGYRYAAPMYYSPGYYTTDKIYLVETNVYSVDQDKLMWSGTTSSMNPTKLDKTVVEIADAVVAKMKKEGFLTK